VFYEDTKPGSGFGVRFRHRDIQCYATCHFYDLGIKSSSPETIAAEYGKAKIEMAALLDPEKSKTVSERIVETNPETGGGAIHHCCFEEVKNIGTDDAPEQWRIRHHLLVAGSGGIPLKIRLSVGAEKDPDGRIFNSFVAQFLKSLPAWKKNRAKKDDNQT
jgi:hypothetical protein